jgi:hypothetical protein
MFLMKDQNRLSRVVDTVNKVRFQYFYLNAGKRSASAGQPTTTGKRKLERMQWSA